MTSLTIRNYYVRHSRLSAPGKQSAALRRLPETIDDIIGAIQGLVIYDVVAADFYGCTLSEARVEDIYLRPVEDILERVLALDSQPLTEQRSVENRVAARCRNYVMLLIGALREKGVPARARCGFGVYFNPGSFEDHWVCEYWDAASDRWKLADPQFDAIWQRKLNVTHDVADVPREQLLVAGDAWTLCRSGKADPSRFGLSFVGLQGLWTIAGNLIRDIAALNGMEMQPWDVWGAMPQPDEQIVDERLAFFDTLAVFSQQPDSHSHALFEAYANDRRLTVPDLVFNALRNRSETLVA